MSQFSHIFKPLTLRHQTLKNRIVFGAHTTNMAVDGLPGEQHIGYYVERAKGGAAMIVVEPMPVHASAVLTRGNFLHSADKIIPHFKKLTDACKAEGSIMVQQLYHVGAHGDWDNSWHANWSPSGGPSYHDNDGSHEMSVDEIQKTIDSFVQAAIRCKKAGFDGIEVWAAYNCLVDQFWAPFSNQRNDEWGGSLENRCRFSKQILREIRAACGDDFIIGLSVADEADIEVSLSHDQLVEIIQLHDAQNLMDYVTCGTGSYFDFYKILPNFQYADNLGTELSSLLKGRLKNAKVMAESLIRTPENANTVIRNQQADLVSIVRGQIADPHLVNKAKENKSEEIRSCLSCNQQCWGRRGRDYWISCLINPSSGREYQWKDDCFSTTPSPKTILIIGAGPAGLECAHVSAQRGHRVHLVEAMPDIGGHFRLAGLQPRRAQITDLINWYDLQLSQLGVTISYNTYIDNDNLNEYQADIVVNATGSLPSETGFQKAIPHMPQINGHQNSNIWTVEDVLYQQATLGRHVIVLDEGGNWRGIGTAWKIAQSGHKITIVTPDALIAKELQRSASDQPARSTLAKLGVHFITETSITAWSGSSATLMSLLTGEITTLSADSLILATSGRVTNKPLEQYIRHNNKPSYIIGDALAPRNAAAAIYEGRKLGLEL